MTVAARILAALDRGPLYEGALFVVVGGTRDHFYRVLGELARDGLIARHSDNPHTWRAVS